MFNTIDKDFHKTRRRVVSPAFSVKYLTALESLMSDSINEFVQHINSAVDTANVHNLPSAEVDMWRLLQSTALVSFKTYRCCVSNGANSGACRMLLEPLPLIKVSV